MSMFMDDAHCQTCEDKGGSWDVNHCQTALMMHEADRPPKGLALMQPLDNAP